MVMMFVEVERGGGEFVSSRVKSKSWYVSTVGIKFYGGHRYSEERCRELVGKDVWGVRISSWLLGGFAQIARLFLPETKDAYRIHT